MISPQHASWERARRIADALPDDDPDRTSMRIAPRTKLCGSAWRGVQPNIADRFEELRELCTSVGDNASLVIGMTAVVFEHMFYGRVRGRRWRLNRWCCSNRSTIRPRLLVRRRCRSPPSTRPAISRHAVVADRH